MMSKLKRSQSVSLEGTECGDYNLHRMIGKGTFGKVYLGTCKSAKLRGGDTFTPTNLAIKMIDLSLSTVNKKQKDWLDREINILNQPELKTHPNIVKYVEFFAHDKYLCIVMGYCEGGNLYDYIRRPTMNISEDVFRQFLNQIVNGLEFLHSKAIIHRDIKTKNILLSAHNDIIISDFGVARKVDELAVGMTKRVGTPNCMSPEIFDSQNYTLKTDIWSLGCVCYEMGAKEFAFPGSSYSEIHGKVVSKELPDLNKMPYCSEIVDLTRRMLSFSPDDRPSAQELKSIVKDQISKSSLNMSKISNSLEDSAISSLHYSGSADLGSTLKENNNLRKLSFDMQMKIIKMIGDNTATMKLGRIIGFFSDHPTDNEGLNAKVKEVIEDERLAAKILPFVLALKGMEEGIKNIPG